VQPHGVDRLSASSLAVAGDSAGGGLAVAARGDA
jgi:acetyl esterase/lipase